MSHKNPIPAALISDATAVGRSVLMAADVAAQRTALSVYSAAETDAEIVATVGGLLYKGSCRAVAVANVASLSGTTTIDDVALVAGNRVLLTAQSTASQNGPWIIAAGAWARPTPVEVAACAAFPVSEGTTYHDTLWFVTTNDPIGQGVTSIALSQLALNIPSTQITDSTVAGRAVLTAVDAAAQRTALSVPSTSEAMIGVVAQLALCTYAVNAGTLEVIGRMRFDPATWSKAAIGYTTVLTLRFIGDVSAAFTGTVVLYNLTANSTDATVTVTETSPTAKSASVALPGVATIYELRCSHNGTPVTDYATVSGAVVEITWS
jgi:hypothetical protein